MPAGGYFGQALVVDVTDGTSTTLPLPEEVLRAYVGGAGLGAWLLYGLGPAGGDPLGPDAPLVRLVHREQGLMVAPGNPLRLGGIEDLTQPGVRYVNRQRGAGTRVLLDHRLTELGIPPDAIAGYAREEPTHLAVAAAIAAGRGDAGLGITAAARAFGSTSCRSPGNPTTWWSRPARSAARCSSRCGRCSIRTGSRPPSPAWAATPPRKWAAACGDANLAGCHNRACDLWPPVS